MSEQETNTPKKPMPTGAKSPNERPGYVPASGEVERGAESVSDLCHNRSLR